MMIRDVFNVERGSKAIPLLANIPHSSTHIPFSIRESFVISDDELKAELLKMTDWFVDELFSEVPENGGTSVVYNCSRLVVDPERFEDDEREVMSSRGMGVIYTKTSDGKMLRKAPLGAEREELLRLYYRPYHSALETETESLLHSFGRCLILDCHSFPSKPLPCDLDQNSDRPNICLGTDSHTPERLLNHIEAFLKQYNLSTARNVPFEGTYVPLRFLNEDRRVSSIMTEINRKLYMDETTGERSQSFDETKGIITELVKRLPGWTTPTH